MNLAPLPCWRQLTVEEYRGRIAELVEVIVGRAAARRSETGIEPLGPIAILRQHTFSQPIKTKKSPAPLVHAASMRAHPDQDFLCLVCPSVP